jgi:hypothetical protein
MRRKLTVASTVTRHMDRHTLAVISITGCSLDVLGALYLAYDLLGGKHGPLRTLTRIVTYSVIFGAGFGLALGLEFGLACGLAHGITLGFEYSRVSKHEPDPGFWQDAMHSAIRGLGYAIGARSLLGWQFGTVFGLLSTVGQVIAYRLGIRPALDYEPGLRPRLTKRQFWAAVNRTFGYSVAGYVSGAVARQPANALIFGLRAGLGIGVVTATANALTPFVEWTADNVPEKRMGVFGIVLILIGFALQSVQYWVALLDIPLL